MNVLIAVPWDNLGGVSRVVNTVGNALRANGHTVALLLPDDAPGGPTGLAGFPVHRLKLRPTSVRSAPWRSRLAFVLTFLPTLLTLMRLVRREKIDVVNSHFPGASSAHLSALRRLGVVRLVTSIHGAEMLPSSGSPSFSMRGVRSLLAASDAIVAPSMGYAVAVSEKWPSLDLERTTAIPNGIDPAELGPPASGTPAGQPYILSIATLVPYKGIDVLIRAFAELRTEYPDVGLRLVSDGPNRKDYEDLAAELGLSDRIQFLGTLQRDQIAAQLRDCTLFVLASRTNSESFGIAVAEAMALDRPVIGSRVGGLPSLILHEETGLLVPPGEVIPLAEAMRHMLGDPALRDRLGRAAGLRVRREFLWSSTAARYIALFDQLTAGATHRAPSNATAGVH